MQKKNVCLNDNLRGVKACLLKYFHLSGVKGSEKHSWNVKSFVVITTKHNIFYNRSRFPIQINQLKAIQILLRDMPNSMEYDRMTYVRD